MCPVWSRKRAWKILIHKSKYYKLSRPHSRPQKKGRTGFTLTESAAAADAEQQCGVERPIICVTDVRAAKCVRSIRALTDISNGVA